MLFNESLNLINKFMEDSKIRRYCTEICKGYCCGNCKSISCMKKGNRPIGCAMFICRELRNILFKPKEWQLYNDIMDDINSYWCKTIHKNDIYFSNPENIKDIEKVRFPDRLKLYLEKFDVLNINKIINNMFLLYEIAGTKYII